jgi:hypothetical protein
MISIILLISLIINSNIDISSQQSCQYTPSIEYVGLNLPNTPIVTRSISDCCNFCLANSQCQSW